MNTLLKGRRCSCHFVSSLPACTYPFLFNALSNSQHVVQVTAIFGSSMEVMISVHGENPLVGELFHVADAFVTVVIVAQSVSSPNAAASSSCGGPSEVTPLQLPYRLAPQSPAEIIRNKVTM